MCRVDTVCVLCTHTPANIYCYAFVLEIYDFFCIVVSMHFVYLLSVSLKCIIH